ncbi:alpha-L-fucosidase [Zhouia sp. PK063]|uniref:alpha-L-fucosidase n=1 Tax=Zhouia sp. PK063 TaxID=3373602 RepID=UPI0037941516
MKFSQLTIFSCVCFVLFFLSCSKPVPPPAPMAIVPTDKQIAYQEMEMNAFIHFTINTFTDKEWGYGDESPQLFNPTNVNVDQWISTLKETGFKGVILTCKHHDGFSLFPTKYSDHSIKNSPYKEGKGDIVKEVSDACKANDLKFGVYLSPWDRNRADYGKPSYIAYYRNQLKELFTNYGPIYEMWFDGANGGDGFYGGAKETRKIDKTKYYDWSTTLDSVRSWQPNVLFFSDAGPDIRWCGNEKGTAGKTNWNTITTDTLYAGKAGIEHLLNKGAEDGKNWVPAEVDVSIRPGWFYHKKEDSLVKTPEQLFNIYLTSVGRGSNLLLNIPPDTMGQFHEQDVTALKGFKELLDKAFANNIAQDGAVIASNTRGKSDDYATKNAIDDDKDTYWATDDDVIKASITFKYAELQNITFVRIQEYIKLGQRIKKFHIEAKQGDDWKTVAKGTTIGYQRILKLDNVVTNELKIVFDDALASLVISNINIYK